MFRARSSRMMSAAAMMLAAFAMSQAHAQQVHRQGFEGKESYLRVGATDARVELLQSTLSNKFVHLGRQSEYLSLRKTGGNYCLLEYRIPACRVFDDLTASAWMFSNVSGIAPALRVVLPRDIDPATKQPTVILLKGAPLDVAARWRRLEINKLMLLLDRQVELRQAERKKKVDAREAYAEALVFDLGAIGGDIEVYVDEIEVGPIVDASAKSSSLPDAADNPGVMRGSDGQALPNETPSVRDSGELARTQIMADRLQIGDRTYFMKGIRWTEAPAERLRDWGINTALSDGALGTELYERATKLGIKLVPMLPLVDRQGQPTTPEELNGFLPHGEDPALALFLGGELDRGWESRMDNSLTHLRRRCRGRPWMVDVHQGIREISSKFDMVGKYRFPLFSSLNLTAYQQWLRHQKNLAQPGSYAWTWIQTHPPEEWAYLAYGQGLDQRFPIPVGPQPAQIRLQTYLALAAGYRGVVYSSDRPFSEDLQGRARTLQLALLNLELKLFETFYAKGQTPTTVQTSNPNIEAAIFRLDEATLVMAYWKDRNGQYHLGDCSAAQVKITIANAPEASQAVEVTAADARSLTDRQRTLGGINLTLREFDTVGFVVLTSDNGIYSQYQKMTYQSAALAGAWQTELAEITLAVTETMTARLDRLGVYVEAVRNLLVDARKQLDEAKLAGDRKDHRGAYVAALRCERLCRRVQRRQWEAVAIKEDPELTNSRGRPDPEQVETRNAKRLAQHVVANPFAVSYYTLPEAAEFNARIMQANFGPNRLPSGDFEAEGNLDGIGWRFVSDLEPGLNGQPMLDHRGPRQGRRYLSLSVTANAENAPVRIEQARIEMVSPAVRVQPGQLIRVSGYVRLPKPLVDSFDGAMVWDSLGGETLALRVGSGTKWTPFEFYRPVTRPADVSIHLATTGLGEAQFDDVQIQVGEGVELPMAGKPTLNAIK